VGWFTSIYPVVVKRQGEGREREQICRVKEKLRGIKDGGIGYGVLKYMGQRVEGWRDGEVSFNYLGQFDQVVREGSFRIAVESAGAMQDEREKRKYALDVMCAVEGRKLEVVIGYGARMYEKGAVRELLEKYLERVRRVLRHCLSAEAGGYTPSDFPLADISQRELDMVLGQEREVEDLYPLTPAQQGMLFHSLSDKRPDPYYEQTSLSFEGKFDLLAFEKAWEKVIQRYTCLRTSFVWEGLKIPLQLVSRHSLFKVHFEDWREMTKRDQQRQWEETLSEDAGHDFDLRRSPLIRVKLIRMEENVWQLLFSNHHLILDGWSTSILMKDVMTYYNAYASSELIEMPQPRRYRDFIEWLQKQDKERLKEFWKRRMTEPGVTSPTQLRSVNSSEGSNRHGYGEESILLSEEDTRKLRTFGHHHQLTLNTITQGAWALLMGKFGEANRVIYGVTTSGRPPELTGVENMVGMFINTLPVSVSLDKKEEVTVYLSRMQREQVEMRQYEHSPLSDIAKWRGLSQGGKLFETIFVFENYPIENAVNGSSHELKLIEVEAHDMTNYPLMIMVAPSKQLLLQINFSREQYTAESARQLLRQLRTTLNIISSHPDLTLDDISRSLDQSAEHELQAQERELEEIRANKLEAIRRRFNGKSTKNNPSQ
jgi:non-ribosomal peptide synthase protein (TIGR01720 family)